MCFGKLYGGANSTKRPAMVQRVDGGRKTVAGWLTKERLGRESRS